MKISKKNLLSLIQENITEMAMDFDPNMPERPHADIQAKLQTGDTPLQKVPFPKTGREENDPSHNFQELVGSERYKKVIQNLRQIGNVQAPVTQISSINDYVSSPITRLMAGAHSRIVQIESAHKEQLAQAAIAIVTDVWQIPEGFCQWDVQIVGQEEMDPGKFKQDEPNEENPEQVEIEDTEDIITDLAQLSLERAKRRFINLIIQGASKRGHYMYQMVPDKIQEIVGGEADDLIYNYGVLMSTNDTLYWQMGEAMMGMAKGSIGGEEDVDPQTDPPTIRVRAVNFPIAIHECIKGWLEVVALKGQPENPQEREIYMQASQMEDTLDKERWDLLLGPAIWDKIEVAIPNDLYTNKNFRTYVNFVFMEIFKLPAKKMLVLLKEVVSGSEVGSRLINELVGAVKENMSNYDQEVTSYEANESLERFNQGLDEISDQENGDSLIDELRNLGIRFSSDEEDELDNEDEEEDEY
jgi:hypothetical protein